MGLHPYTLGGGDTVDQQANPVDGLRAVGVDAAGAAVGRVDRIFSFSGHAMML